MEYTTRIHYESDLFQEIWINDSRMFIILSEDVPPKSTLEIYDSGFTVRSMFKIGKLKIDSVDIGFIFHSMFTVECMGSYLLAYMNNWKAALNASRRTESSAELILKNGLFYLYDSANRGSIAINPRFADQIEGNFTL